MKPVRPTTLRRTLSEVLGQRKTAQAALERDDRPATTRRPARSGAAEGASNETATGASILLAEDNAVNRLVAVRVLEKLGCRVEWVPNGRYAVEKVSDGHYDLVFMDCQMPEMDGYEATAEIRCRQSGARVPIVAMTAGAMEEDREKCLLAGMDDHVSKPIDPELIREVIERWTRPAETRGG